MAQNNLLTAEELAARLQIRASTVRAWARRGTIPRLKLSHKVIRYDLAAIVAALAQRREKGERHGQ